LLAFFSQIQLNMHFFKILVLSVFIAACFFVGWINYNAIVEAYGNGAPHFGRTTNMDKWESPVPLLIMIDVGILLISCVSFLVYKKTDKNG